SGIGVLLGGWAADKSARYLAVFVAGLTTFSAMTILAVDILPMASIVAVGLMFASGVGLGASRTPRDVMLKDAAPPGQIGKVFGFVSAGLPLGGAVTPVPFGFLIDRGHPVLVLVAVILLLSLFCAGTARVSSRVAPVTVAAE